MLQVMVAESEFELRVALRRGLAAEDFEVTTAADAASALRVGRSNKFDVIVIDVRLPDLPGYLVVDQLRTAGVSAPILLISATGSDAERAEVLNLGGDGYLAIPFPFSLLVAQLRALARRYRGSWRSGQALQIGKLHIEPETRMITFRGQTIQLSTRECELLHALASRPDVVVAKSELARLVWGPNRSTSNNVEAHIGQVRRKLFTIGAGELVRTVRGHGYMITSLTTEEDQEPRAVSAPLNSSPLPQHARGSAKSWERPVSCGGSTRRV